MPSLETVSTAIGTFYDAVDNPALWPEALEGLVTLCGSAGLALFPIAGDITKPIASLSYVTPDLSEAGAAYFSDWTEESPAIVQLKRRPVIGRSTWDGELVDANVVRAHGFYNDFAKTFGLMHGGMRVTATGFMMLAPFSERLGTPDDERLALFEILTSHVERALALAGRLSAIHGMLAGAGALIAATGHGVLHVRSDGKVLDMNDAASRMLGDGIGADGGRLLLADHRQQRLLEAALAAGDNRAAVALTIERPLTGLPLLVQVFHMGREPAGASPFPPPMDTALVTISDPFAGSRVDVRTALEALGLTPAEARVAAEFADGEAPGRVAQRLAISVSTVRNHLKAIFQKLDLSRQGELVALLARLQALPKDNMARP